MVVRWLDGWLHFWKLLLKDDDKVRDVRENSSFRFLVTVQGIFIKSKNVLLYAWFWIIAAYSHFMAHEVLFFQNKKSLGKRNHVNYEILRTSVGVMTNVKLLILTYLFSKKKVSFCFCTTCYKPQWPVAEDLVSGCGTNYANEDFNVILMNCGHGHVLRSIFTARQVEWNVACCKNVMATVWVFF